MGTVAGNGHSTRAGASPLLRSVLDHPLATRHTAPAGIADQFGRNVPATDDPAWQPPRDPLSTSNPRTRAGVIHREVPLVTVSTSWGVADVRSALAALTTGVFDAPSQLVDAIIGDDRVQATLGSRTGGLLGRPLIHRGSDIPRVAGSADAQACLEAWQNVWPRTMTEPVLSEIQQWGVMMGFSAGQVLWDTSGPMWVPYVRPWHPRYVYYHWQLRRYIAITLDGQVPIEPGDGGWLLHAPHGEYRGWMRGAVRAVAQPWLIRQLAYRDWARLSERHGFPIIKAKTPAAGDPIDIDRFRNDLAQLGQESVIQLPQGTDAGFSYDVELMATTGQGEQMFAALIDRCERSIILALLFQNLTTEIKEGSYAAARVHADVRQSALEADARALSHTIYTQIARPFAALNFGDPDLAPLSTWEITPYEDNGAAASTLATIASAVASLRQSGVEVGDVAALCESFGVRMSAAKLKMIEPLAVEVEGAKPAAAVPKVTP